MNWRCSVFVLALSLLQLLPGAASLSPPYGVHAAVKEDCVVVRWQHEESAEPVKGYYVSLQLLERGRKSVGDPHFVYAGNEARSAEIRGLKPRAMYQMTVIAYSEGGHEASKPTLVRTYRLGFLLAHNLSVSAVTAESAMFHWSHAPHNNIHDVNFKLVCMGVQRFTREGKPVEEWTDFEHEVLSSSKGKESYYGNGLLPNTHYTCYMASEAGGRESRPSTELEFTTAPGRPNPPPQPMVPTTIAKSSLSKQQEEEQFSVLLFPTDDQNGPISHYKVFAVPMLKKETKGSSEGFEPKVPFSKLLTKSVTAQLVAKVSEPLPFLVESYKAGALPETLTFDGRWMQKAFKPKTYYTITVAAFTKTEDGTESLHSFSEPAEPPVYIGEDMQKQWVKQHKPAAQRFATTVVITLLSVLGVFTIAFAVVFVSGYYQDRKRNAHFFSVADSDSSSEDELFRKEKTAENAPLRPKRRVSPLRERGEEDPLPPPSPHQARSDWAVENVCYNPAFEGMVYRSPETMQEMDFMLNRIAERHTQRMRDVQASHTQELPALSDSTPVDTPTTSQRNESVAMVTDAEVEEGPRSPSPLPTYYYTASVLAPGESIEDYNVVADASPMSSVHRTTPPSVVRSGGVRPQKSSSQTAPQPQQETNSTS